MVVSDCNIWHVELPHLHVYLLGGEKPRNLIEQNTVWLKYKWNNEEINVNCWSKNWIPPVFCRVRITRSLVSCVCFVDRCLSFWYFSFDHCVVYPSSIYQFWLPIWYLQTLHENYMTETCSKNCEPIEYIDVTFLISILLSWLTKGFTTSVTLGGPLVEQDMCTLSVYLIHLRLILCSCV